MGERMRKKDKVKKPYIFVDAKDYIVADILHELDYTGEFRFPKWVPDTEKKPKWEGGPHPVRRAEPQELRVVLPDRHEPYVTREQWDANVATLQSNAPTKSQRSFGDGPALLQRLVACGVCGRTMTPAYKPKRLDGSECHGYHCAICNYRIPGNVLDLAVIKRAFGERLSEDALVPMRDAWRSAVAALPQQRTARLAALEEAERHAGAARMAYQAVDPWNRFAAAELEKEWNEKLAKVEELRASIDKTSAELELFDEAKFAELLELCKTVNSLFYASTTTILDRKMMLGALLARVVFEGRTSDILRVRFIWKDGHRDTPLEVDLFRAAYPVIAKLVREGKDYQTIADELNANGYMNKNLRSWKHTAVGAAARSMGLGVKRSNRHEDDADE
jgi:hypothetical protein